VGAGRAVGRGAGGAAAVDGGEERAAERRGARARRFSRADVVGGHH